MEKWSLTALADGLLSHALSTSSRRGMREIGGGRPQLLYQTVIALAGGQRIEEQDNLGEASVQVLRGRVRITVGDDIADGSPGQLLSLPDARHTLTALEDAVLLLTVAKRTPPIAADPGTALPVSYQRRRRRPMPALVGVADRATITRHWERSP